MTKKVFLIVLAILFLGMVTASFSVGNISHSIQKIYAPGGTITGWVNVSFTNEPLNSLLKDSDGKSAELKKLLAKNNDFDYTCTPQNCGGDYSASDGEETKTFYLEAGKSKFIGFKFMSNLQKINSMKFDVESDATSSCENQLKINFFEKNIFVGNNKSLAETCSVSENYGCFNPELAVNQYTISATPFCQKLNLSEAPGFSLGAWVVAETSGNKKLTMTLYNSFGDNLKSCDLSGITSEGNEVSCGVNYPTTSVGEYYVCISSDAGTGTYKTKGYSMVNSCGFQGAPVKSLSASYQIFAKAKKFADFGTLTINNAINNDKFGDLIEDYISEKYSSLNCNGGCVIPIEFISGKNQTIILKNLSIDYEETAGQTTEKRFYNLNKTEAKISSGFGKLFFDEAGFSAPTQYGNKTFTLNLNNQKVFSEVISVSQVIPLINGISPTTTAAAFPTKFRVNINSSMPIVKYDWNFGNNSLITAKNEIVYSFDKIGIQQLKVTVTDSLQQTSSKTFDIEVVSPKETINITLNKNFANLAKVKTQINAFTGFYKESLNSLLDIETAESILQNIRVDYNNVTVDSEYINIMGELAEIRIPQSISTSSSANSIQFYPNERDIDLDVLKSVSGGNYGANKEKYNEAVFAWHQENIDAKINFREISANYEEGSERLLNFFEIDVGKKTSINYDYYFILKIGNATFDGNYGQKTEGVYFYITNPSQKIIFSTKEEIDFSNLPAFVAPAINRLSVIDDIPGKTPTEKPTWWLFVAIIAVLLITGATVYVILHQWYKHKYENHLFKDRNNLFNLITYIDNAKKKGLAENEIDAKLKQAGWNSEQRDYALKKHGGRRTGMLELPITKIFEKLKEGEGENISQGRIPN